MFGLGLAFRDFSKILALKGGRFALTSNSDNPFNADLIKMLEELIQSMVRVIAAANVSRSQSQGISLDLQYDDGS